MDIKQNIVIKKLQNSLKELFQINSKDLDFGIYKIYGVLNEKLNSWVDKELPGKIKSTLNSVSGNEKESFEKQLKLKVKRINEILVVLGKNLNEDLLNLEECIKDYCKEKNSDLCKLLNEIKDLQNKIKETKKTQNLPENLAQYIYDFYNGIYKTGDFILPRKTEISNDLNSEDVVFDWKTKGQILIKNFDLQTYYSFNTPSGYEVKIKVDKIIDYGSNDKNQGRYFLPFDFKLDDKVLEIKFIFGKLDDKTLEGNKEQIENLFGRIDDNLKIDEKKITFNDLEFGSDKNNGVSLLGSDKKIGIIHLIKLFLDKVGDDNLKEDLFGDIKDGILNDKSKILDFKKDGLSSLLRKNLFKYYRLGTSDFFLNPNLKEELSNYKEDFMLTKLRGYLKSQDIPEYKNLLNSFETITDEINNFLVTIENIQIELFNQRKKVLESHYVITFDKLKLLNLNDNFKGFLVEYLKDNYQNLIEDYKINLGFDKDFDNVESFVDYAVNEDDKLYIDTKSLINKEGKTFDEVYGKTSELIDFILNSVNGIIKEYNSGNLNKEEVLESFKKLGFDKIPNEKLAIDDLLNGYLYKGDNYQALNLLKYEVENGIKDKIKTVYIDPPYNTGSDGFVYKDNMMHGTWLSMMEGRLRLAKELMRDEGVIFSSIDDNEVDNLKKLEGEVFGDNNFVKQIVWESGKPFGFKATKTIWPRIHEYILEFSKTIKFDYKQTYTEKLSNSGNPILTGSIIKVDLDKIYSTDFIQGAISGISSYGLKGFGSGQKPYKLINKLILSNNNQNNTILDFFPGSGTTADAIIRLNTDDLGNRKFILTEINDYFDTIIIPRIKKVAYNLKWKDGKPVDNKGPGIFFQYNYLETYEDTLENFALRLEGTVIDKTLQDADFTNNLQNLAYILSLSFETTKTEIDIWKDENSELYPSILLANDRNDIHTFKNKDGKIMCFVDTNYKGNLIK